MELYFKIFIGVFLCAAAVYGQDGESPNAPPFISNERKLYHKIIDGLEKAVRPVRNAKDAVQLQVGLSLVRIDDLDEKGQKLNANIWLRMMWNDPQLAWKPEEHDDIKSLRVPCEKIWLPDLTLYNSAHGNQDPMPCYPWMQVVVSSDGSVLYVPHYKMEATCALDLSKFPYDTQECELKLGSWTFEQALVNISHFGGAHLDMSTFSEHGVWDVDAQVPELHGITYDCCPDSVYQHISYKLTMKRRSNYYTQLFITPSLILAFLTPTMFWLPPDGNEKMSLGSGIMLGHILLLVMLEQSIPAAHPVIPLIGVYYIFGIVMVALALVLSVMIRNIWSQGNRRKALPGFVRTVVLGVMGRLMCVRREPYMAIQELQDMESEGDEKEATNKMAAISSITRSEWRQLAVILDRVFFVLFLLVVIIVTAVIS